MSESDKNIAIESSTEKDFEQEKEEETSFVDDEERQVQDEVEKDLQLSIDTAESDEMSQLNPDAKEFIPVSPTRSNGPMSPPLNGQMNPVNPMISNLATSDDTVVAQSPRKGEFQAMEDVQVPSELDFDNEADARPHEFDLLGKNGDFQRIESPELLNLKESLQQDDKLEKEYKDEAFFDEEKQQTGEEYKVLESSFNEYSNGFQNVIDDAMNRSFYEGRDDGDILTATATQSSDLLNTVQPIPTFEDESPEADHQNFVIESEKPEADLMADSAEFKQELAVLDPTPAPIIDATPAPPMDASDHFEAERFVEEIKSANSEFDKYVDQELSPTLPEFSLNTIQNVQETIIVEKAPLEPVQDFKLDTFITDTSTVSNIEVPVEIREQLEFELEAVQLNGIPEDIEPLPTSAGDDPVVLNAEPVAAVAETEQVLEVKEEPKVEALGEVIAAAAAIGAVAGIGAIKKKTTTASKTEVKKTDVKAKAPVAAAKTNPVPAKRVPASSSAATLKSSSAAAPAKPLAARKVAPLAAKPAVPAAAASRPAKPTSSTVPPARKPISRPVVDSSAPKPTPATRTTATTLAKKPATSVAAAK